MLSCIITGLGPLTGASFNPAITGTIRAHRGTSSAYTRDSATTRAAGGLPGKLNTPAMFGQPLLQTSKTKHRTRPAQWFAKSCATAGLLFGIIGVLRSRVEAVPTPMTPYMAGA